MSSNDEKNAQYREIERLRSVVLVYKTRLADHGLAVGTSNVLG